MQRDKMTQQQITKSEELMVICPSFSSYATNGLAAIAAKVTDDFESLHEDVDEFEFSLVLGDDLAAAVESDEVISAGQIRIRPFITLTPGRDILIKIDDNKREIISGINDIDDSRSILSSTTIGIPLRELFLDDGRCSSTSSSSSLSSTEQELEPRAYCFWRPKSSSGQSSPSKWKKSNSTAKRWRLRDLLRRSNSDGDMTTPKHREARRTDQRRKIADHSISPEKGRNSVDSIGASPSRLQSLYGVLYARAEKEGGRRKSYLPYKQNLVGIFAG